MDYMLQHESLVGALSRTLRDNKKNLDITQYLLNIFYAYSNFTDYHPFLLTNKIGDTCVMIIEYETQRYVTRMGEYKAAKELIETTKPSAEVDIAEMRKQFKKEEKRL